MKFINQIHDALKYTLNDWVAIVLLGIIICISDSAIEYTTNNLLLLIFIFIISVIVLVFEEGYRYQIISETLQGRNSPPIIRNIPALLKEGFIEVITLIIYLSMNIIFISIFTSLYYPEKHFIIWLTLFCLSQIVIMLFFGAPIHKALNQNKFLSAFDLVGILKLYYKMGFFQTIFMIIISLIGQNIIFSSVVNFGILESEHFIEFLLNFFLAPIVLLFETRLISLCGKEALSSQN